MPPDSATGQADSARAWFRSDAGLALLESERPTVLRALSERPAMPWLWLAPVEQDGTGHGHGLSLTASGQGWSGAARCRLPLPLASESIGVVVLQHVAAPGRSRRELFEECARVLAPGGRLWVFALNPLAPYRWQWRGTGLGASEPLSWRRRLRAAGSAVIDLARVGIGRQRVVFEQRRRFGQHGTVDQHAHYLPGRGGRTRQPQRVAGVFVGHAVAHPLGIDVVQAFAVPRVR